MRQDKSQVEIKGPPLKELKRNGSCFTRTCLSGCGCIIIFVFGFLVLVKFASTPRQRELKNLPAGWEEVVPIYDPDSIEKIEYDSGEKRGRLIDAAAWLPKLVLAPIIVELEKVSQNKADAKKKKDEEEASYLDWDKFKEIAGRPTADHRDIYRIEWSKLPAQPAFIYNYYQTELTKKDFFINLSSEGQNTRQFTFSKDDISGAVYIQDDILEKGTDYVLMVVKISPFPEN